LLQRFKRVLDLTGRRQPLHHHEADPLHVTHYCKAQRRQGRRVRQLSWGGSRHPG
jgi:hypothetical protein